MRWPNSLPDYSSPSARRARKARSSWSRLAIRSTTGSGLFDAPPSSRSCPGDFWQAKVIARINLFAFALSVPSSRAGADDFIIGSSTRARESGV